MTSLSKEESSQESTQCLGEAVQRPVLSCRSLKYVFDTIDTYSCCDMIENHSKPFMFHVVVSKS